MKLGIHVSQATVAKYMVRHRKPPSQTWRTFLTNHVSQLASVDFFTVHTIWFEIVFVFIVLTHDRRRILHFNVTTHPTAEWTAQQIVEAFPFDSAPKYLLRDRDRIYGHEFAKQVEVMGIQEVLVRHDLRGNTRMRNVSLVRSAGSVWTMSLCSAKNRFDARFSPTSAIITGRVCIYRWTRIRRIHARSSLSEKSLRFLKWAASTTATTVALPEHSRNLREP